MMAVEKELSSKARKCSTIMKILKKATVMKAVSKMGDYFPSRVTEFVINFVSLINEHGCSDYQKVHVRGNCLLERPTDKTSWKSPPINDIVLVMTGGIHNS